MKQSNFDVVHELDEFLLAEKPLTHTKRKAIPDLEKMKPELRQLEEQYARVIISPTYPESFLSFMVYDFTRMTRMSYYPLHGASVGTNSDSTDRTLAQSATGTINPVATVLEPSRAGSPESYAFGRPSMTRNSTVRNSVRRHPAS